MAGAIGPSSYLPGRLLKLKPGSMCDDHPDRPSTHRMVGETDSFGSEILDMCQECYDKYLSGMEEAQNIPQTCEWCGAVTTDCADTRDMDEGMYGPVYSVCGACRRAESQRISEELDALSEQVELQPYGPDDGDDIPDDDGVDIPEPEQGTCEMCKQERELFPTRYTEEGFGGDYHLICTGCRQKQTKQDLEDLDELLDRDDDPA